VIARKSAFLSFPNSRNGDELKGKAKSGGLKQRNKKMKMEKEEKKKTKDYLNLFTCQSHILNIGPRIHWTWNFKTSV
jgi:hypothetical protein